MNKSLANFDTLQSALLGQAFEFGPKLFVALVILVAGYYCSAWVARLLDNSLARMHLDRALSTLIVRIVRVAVVALFVVLALQNLGVQLLPLIAGLGVAGAGVALAMQGLLSNLAAGFVIVFTRPFKIGEYISIVGVEGTVTEITLFSTILSHGDLSRVVVPNRKIIGEILHNYGQIRQVNVNVRIAYEADVSLALTTVQQVLRATTCVLQDPVPAVQVAALEADAIRIAVCPWVAVADYGRAAGELNRALLTGLQAAGVAIPLPQREIRMVGAR